MNVNARELERLSIDELLMLYDRIGLLLSKRIENEKRKLEETLLSLRKGTAQERALVRHGGKLADTQRSSQRRKYPPVLPKYRNPNDRSQTWTGRGKKPRWVVEQLKAGKKITDFLIKAKAGTQSRA